MEESCRVTLPEILKETVVQVTFTKADGNTRVMNCTLNPTYLPESNTSSTRSKNEDVLAVWDIDNNGWRSFRYDSVQSYVLNSEKE